MRAAMLVATWLVATTPAVTASGTEATVSVRTFDYANVVREHLVAARTEAGQIFGSAGIAVRWIDCRVSGKADGDACTEPLVPGRDLMLRLVDRTPADLAPVARVLGESMVDREERGGVLMTVDLFPVRTVADRASTGLPVLLGRAIAHEIGHLLLGSTVHSSFGLMRAFWSHDELRGAKPANWGFSVHEAARMRQTLRGRCRRAD